METFVAVVQDMLAAIAVKYNLKEKGLDPEAVPEIVAQAFARDRPQGRRAASPAAPVPAAGTVPPRVVIAQPEGVEPAYPGQAGAEVSPVSEELLHRAIRSNVELAETLGQLVRDLSQGLGTIHGQADQLLAAREDAARAASVASIRDEVRRLQAVLQDVGQATAGRTGPAPGGAPRAPAPPQVPPTPPRRTVAEPAAPRARPSAVPPTPLAPRRRPRASTPWSRRR